MSSVSKFCHTKHIIMLLSNAFDPDPRVYQEATSLVQHGYRVAIICWDRESKKKRFETIDGIGVERIYVRSTHGRGITQLFFLNLFWIKAFLRLIPLNFDIIHCHDFDTLPLGFVIARLRAKKIVYDAHESYCDMLTKTLPYWFIRMMIATEDFLIKRVDLLITVGSLLEKEFQKRGARKTCVVGNWKRLEDYDIPQEKGERIKRELGVPKNKLIISFIAWLTKERKLLELFKAVTLSQNVHLIIGGDGPYRKLVEKEARENKHITYLGYVRAKDIPLYTSLADIILYSFDKENPNSQFSAPNKLFEALAAGKAIISGDYGEIGKIIVEEDCGVVLESITIGNLLKAFNFLSHSPVLNKYHKNAFNAARRKYNWEQAEKLLLKNYENV